MHTAANTEALEAQVQSMRGNAARWRPQPADHSSRDAGARSLSRARTGAASRGAATPTKAHAYEQYMRLQPRRASFVTSQTSSLGTTKPTMMENINAYYAQPGDGGSSAHEGDLLKRESLRFEPRILRWLDALWKVTDHDSSGSVDWHEFHKMFNVLYCALVGGEDDPAAVQQLARREWEHDTAGKSEMSKRLFKQSWFQLTDMVSIGASFSFSFRRWRCDIALTSPPYPPHTYHTHTHTHTHATNPVDQLC